MPQPEENSTLKTSEAVVPCESLLEAALWWAGNGFPVFPLNGKSPAIPGPEGGQGFKDATTDLDQIRAWWGRWTGANIGMATGEVSGIDVLDIDPRNGGTDSLERLLAHGEWPETYIVETGSGGHHVWFRHAAGLKSRNDVRPGIDLKAEGGYAVVPPSIHPVTGEPYTVYQDVPIADWPDWLLEVVRKPSPNGRRSEPITISAALEDLKVGNRDDWFFRLASKFRAVALPLPVALKIQSWIWEQTPQTDTDGTPEFYPLETALEKVERTYRTYPPGYGVDQQAKLPHFPIDALPDPIRTYCETVAEAIGCPVEFVAVPLLTLAGAAIGKTRRLRVKGGWEVLPVLWTGFVAPPGTAKSAALRKAMDPLIRLQRDAKVTYDEKYQAWHAAEKEDKGAEPRLRHFWSNDATPEALAEMLDSSDGIAIIQDELLSFVKGFDRYKSGEAGERQRYLSLWSSGDWKVNRRTKGASLLIEEPVVCVTGGIQPEMLAELPAAGGRRDGFLERFLLVYPPASVALWSETEIPDELTQHVAGVFKSLCSETHETYGLAPEAKARWVAFHDELAIHAAETTGLTSGVLLKANDQCLRLALVLHVLSQPSGIEAKIVSDATMERAIALTEYLVAHTVYTLAQIERLDPQQEKVFEVIERHGDWLSTTAIRDALDRNLYGDRLRAVLRHLQAAGLIEHRRNAATGGRHADEWRAIRRGEDGEEPGDDA